mgnify:CR=1 FL=1
MTENNHEDTRLKDSLKFANYRATLNNQQKKKKTNFEAQSIYSMNGGTFKLTPLLITYVKTLIDTGFDSAVILDINDTPIMIDDLEDFSDDINEKYLTLIREYYLDYEKIKEARSVEDIITEW